MNAANWIALAAVLIAGLSFLSSQIERRQRKSEIGTERDKREEQAQKERHFRALVEKRLHLELGDRAENRLARLRAVNRGVNGGVEGGRIDRHRFDIKNVGVAPARDIEITATRQDGDVVARAELVAVLPLQFEGIDLEIPLSESRNGGLQLWARWEDGAGPHHKLLRSIGKHG